MKEERGCGTMKRGKEEQNHKKQKIKKSIGNL